MRIQKIAKATITSAAAFVIAVAPAFATTTGATSLINSGDDAFVHSSTSNNSEVFVNNNNSAHVNQDVNAYANTGNNTVDGNISLGGGGAAINTGSAGVSTNLGVDVNKNYTGISGAGIAGHGANFTDVVNTGDYVHVDTNTNNSNTVGVSNNNHAGVSQDVWQYANTGGNKAADNIGGPTTINTGGAGVSTGLGVKANENSTVVGGGAGALSLGGPLNQTSLTNTGDDASIHSNASSSNAAFVNNHNSLWVAQDIGSAASTGNNKAVDNIGGPTYINTGYAGTSVGASVNANSNWTGISGGYGGGLGFNASDFVNTGDDLHANTNVYNNSFLSVANANHAHSYQDIWSKTYTGGNKSADNIGGYAGIGTGGAGAGANLGFSGNQNATSIGGWAGGLMNWFSM